MINYVQPHRLITVIRAPDALPNSPFATKWVVPMVDNIST